MRDSMDRPRRPGEAAASTDSGPPGSGDGSRPAWLTGIDMLEPPPQARARVLAAMREASRSRPSVRSWRAPRWSALAAGVAAIALAAWVALLGPDRPAGGPGGTGQAPDNAPSRADLLATSEQLETLLALLPAQRRLMRAGTATTIAALETQIAAIDERLSVAPNDGLAPDVEQLLWRERVDALNALVQVRYGQSQLFEF